MIVIPDLFGAFQKGRESAIDANWKDLQNYESIENARHQNDAAALANLATMADFGKERQIKSNQTTNSDVETGLNIAQMPSKLNIAQGDALLTGMQLRTLEDNKDAVGGALADQLGAYVIGSRTGYNNAVVDDGKSTIARDVFTSLYPTIRMGVYDKTRADSQLASLYGLYQPIIASNTYQADVYTSGAGKDTAQVNSQYAKPRAHASNQASITGYNAQTAENRFAKDQIGAQNITLVNDAVAKYQSAIDLLVEQQKGLPKNSPEWKNKQLQIDNLRQSINNLGEYFGVPSFSNYRPYEVYAPVTTGAAPVTTGAASGTPPSTGTKTVVDRATGRAIQVPTTATGVSLFGTPNIPTTTGTRAVVTNNPMGGNNYTGNVSNWESLVNSDAGQFIQNLFIRK